MRFFAVPAMSAMGFYSSECRALRARFVLGSFFRSKHTENRQETRNNEPPFDASNIKYQDCAGTCISSSLVVAAFKVDLNRFNASQAWITNGADPFRFGLDQLNLYNGQDDEEKTHGARDLLRPLRRWRLPVLMTAGATRKLLV